MTRDHLPILLGAGLGALLALAGAACSKHSDKPAEPPATQLPDKPRSGLEVSITSVDATSYQLGNDALAAAMLEGLAGDVRVAASTEGYRITQLRTGSVLARAGLLTGDVVSKLAGVPLRGADSLFTAYQAARGGGFEVELMRGRDSVRLRYTLRGSASDFGMGGLLPRPAPAPTLTVGPTSVPGITVTSVSPELLELEVSRTELDRLLSDPTTVARSARIVPSMKNGFPNGIKLYAVRPNSIYAAAGLQNGDTITSVNGDALTSADSALAIYTKLKTASKVRVQITRRGAEVTLVYTIK
ncbi:MAG: PDZ domain-containing protein [Deltaproteobacteria bacterium]|nr:PDZ domain-containing protein [Deltaproteobacteria bacterium]